MALSWLSERFEPGGDPGEDPSPFIALWASAAEADAAAIWERIAPELGGQAGPPLWWKLSGPLAALPEAQRRAALASAGVAAASVLGVAVFVDGSAPSASGGSLMTDVSQLAVATELALHDGALNADEIGNLNAISDAIAARLLDGAPALTGAELDRTIGTLAAARAALIEHLTLSPGSGQPTLDRMATLSALAVQLRIARGDMGTLVVARPADPRAAAVEELVGVSDLPLTVTAGGLGSVQVLGSTAALQVGEVAAAPGWAGQVVTGEGDALTVHFERGPEAVRVVVRLSGSDVVVSVTDQSPATAAPAGAIDIQAFAVRLAGFVVLERDDGALRVRRVEPEWGWQAGAVETHDTRVSVAFSGPVSSVRFRAELRNGVIHTEVRELPLASAPPTPEDLEALLGALADEGAGAGDPADPPIPSDETVPRDEDDPGSGGLIAEPVSIVAAPPEGPPAGAPPPDTAVPAGTEDGDTTEPSDPADSPPIVEAGSGDLVGEATPPDDGSAAPTEPPPPGDPATTPVGENDAPDDPNEGDPNEGDPNEGDPNEGDPNEGDPNEGDPNEGDPNEGDPDEGDPDGQPSDPPAERPVGGATPVAQTIESAGGSVAVEADGRRIEALAASAAAGWTVERQSFQGASALVVFAMGTVRVQVEVRFANGSLVWSVQELRHAETEAAAAPAPAPPDAGPGRGAGPRHERGRGGGG